MLRYNGVASRDIGKERMSRRRKDPLRTLSADERSELARLSRSRHAPAARVARATALLAVADGRSYLAAARRAGRRDGDTVAAWVARFNREGLAGGGAGPGGGARGGVPAPWGRAADPLRRAAATAHPRRGRAGAGPGARRHGDVEPGHAAQGPAPRRGRAAQGQHLHDLAHPARGRPELAAQPDLVLDRHRLAQAPGRRCCGGGHRRRCRREKNLIERAYGLGPEAGLAVWCEDEAGPFQAVPHPGGGWRPVERPAIRPHEYVRQGTTKILTLFHPATGEVRVRPAARGTNAVLHGWLKETLAAIAAALPAGAAASDPAATRALWEAWQQGLALPFTLPERLPPLRVLLVWDNLAGHKTPEMVLWLCRHGIMPLYTPLGGSWLNMAESIQRILKRRALDGQQPRSPAEIGAWFEQTARSWNRQPTPFVWNGKGRRRGRRPDDGHPVGGSAAHTQRPLSHYRKSRHECRTTCQTTH